MLHYIGILGPVKIIKEVADGDIKRYHGADIHPNFVLCWKIPMWYKGETRNIEFNDTKETRKERADEEKNK